ncbi:hypothetical protein NDU88_001954 [Pleurodeles waltl]|uniref:Uncharacterized protein n=1 Tax=Pleurodeles waltl TaxID=8319 RepID=A0AAV7V984_PLEWA|nr:hypothetical protein NDU88_001954 [Pleurodeles waltl]
MVRQTGGRGDKLEGPGSHSSVVDVQFSPSRVRGAVGALGNEESLEREGVCPSQYQCDDRARASDFNLQGQGRSARQGAQVRYVSYCVTGRLPEGPATDGRNDERREGGG